MAVETKSYTVEEFFRIEALPENTDKLLELIDGEIVTKVPSFTPSRIAVRIAAYITMYLFKNEIGYVTGEAGGYVMAEGNVFNPDVGYISKERLPQIPTREVLVPPDLAVEVKSPTDSKRAMRRKADQYLASGTKQVWLVFPEEYVVEVYSPENTEGRILSYDGVLDGGVALPGFSLQVSEVFGPKP